MPRTMTNCSNDPAHEVEREQFSSRIGFIIAAAGCAVGVGNIWSFPIQTAENGGAAFTLVYLCFSFILAYPTLVAELNIGRYRQSNNISAMASLSKLPALRLLGAGTAVAGLLTMTLIYSFYSIVGGWFIGFSIAPVASLAGMTGVSQWLSGFTTSSSIVVTLLFMTLTTLIVTEGVKDGIERWCNRLMPSLFVLLAVLIAFALTRPGGMEGLRVYLLPDFSRILDHKLLISALGQSFFSMSLGTGCMMVYGSYLSRKANLPKTALQVTLVDSSVAFLAGMLIIPCMYAATHQGVEIFNAQGHLYSADKLVFNVLPTLFDQLGMVGQLVAAAFFLLLTIAALTSSISMMEPVIAAMVERLSLVRQRACWLLSLVSAAISSVIIVHIDTLLGLAVTFATQYMQPLLCLMIAIYGSWVIRQDRLLSELSQGYPELESSLFWKIWPWYTRLVCPGLILLLLIQNL
ncbi:putative sodium:tyrosine symporter [Endozoicomonas montiporae CL-33]|uniref:Putative sodium:tyrosine symporter n=1 Tax=Endozoicomonas montiporae CL-33 TaxID=570277 RepID=A0A142B8T1_9GAMM|nr:putative sodium:tyrosine symporter [Endozoicomonas montiporae CL-33]